MAGVENLTEKEGKYLLGVARKTIEKSLFGPAEHTETNGDLPPAFLE